MKKALWPLLAAMMVLLTCLAWAGEASGDDDSDDNSRTSLDWAGTYKGVIPDGTEVEVTLRLDHRYVLVLTPPERTDAPVEYKGTFAWGSAGGTVLLNNVDSGPANFQVRENALLALDDEGKPHKGKQADRYLLKKTSGPAQASLVGTRWAVIELGGAAVQVPADGTERPYFQLDEKTKQVSGFAGCNGFSGKFEHSGKGKFDLSELISTMMACPQMELETKLLQALELAEGYTVHDETLTLTGPKDVSLARFQASSSSENR